MPQGRASRGGSASAEAAGTWLAAAWAIVAATLVAVDVFQSDVLSWPVALYLVLTLVAGGVTFLVYGYDKWRARRRKPRVSERSLHVMAVCGGWPGALLGQAFFRHKTFKRSFQALTWTIVALHAALVVAAILWWTRGASP